MELSPKQVAKLTSCIRENVANVADELGMEPHYARFIRRAWVLQLTGRCLQCDGGYMKGNVCSRCESTISDEVVENKMRVLRQLSEEDPNTIVIRRKCACGQTFTYTAKYVLAKSEKYGGNFKPSSECGACRLQRDVVRAKARAKAKKRNRKKIEPITDDTRLVRQDPNADEFRNSPKTDVGKVADMIKKAISS